MTETSKVYFIEFWAEQAIKCRTRGAFDTARFCEEQLYSVLVYETHATYSGIL